MQPTTGESPSSNATGASGISFPDTEPGTENVRVVKRHWSRFSWVCIAALAMHLGAEAQSPSAPCKQGFVWREAFPRDYVCVTPQARNQAAQDNADPASAEPCRAGYVWREARPADHVCVPVARRSAVAEENRLAPRRVAHPQAIDTEQ